MSLCRLFLCCAALITLGAQPAPAQNETGNFVAAIQRLKRSVAPVACMDKSASGPLKLVSILGTAVFVSKDGSFLTADHILNAITTQTSTNPCPVTVIYFPVAGWRWVEDFDLRYVYFSVADCIRDATQDLAVCRPAVNVKELTGAGVEPVVFATVPPADGTPVAFTGFPRGNALPISSRGVIAGYGELQQHGPRKLIVDKIAWPGSSGSPVYTDDANVVGIVLSTGDGDSIGLTFARTAAYVRRFLASTHPPKPAP